MNAFPICSALRRLVLVLLFALPMAAGAVEPRSFATPEAAMEALIAALKANDDAALTTLFGDKHKDVVTTGDRAVDAVERARAAAELASFRALREEGADRRIVLMGAQAWPFPIPLVRKDGAWRFAAEEGVEELLNRRIGRNERSAIQVLRAYVGAQREYASRDRNGDGVLQYAQKLASAAGKHDGLYWPADTAKGEEASPFGPLIAQSAPFLAGHRKGEPYRGYRFRILARQGASAPGGAYSYVINGRMVAGFAMVAYPADYGTGGVMTFIVNQNGKVYEKDFGESSADFGTKMLTFNPGAGWKEVAP